MLESFHLPRRVRTSSWVLALMLILAVETGAFPEQIFAQGPSDAASDGRTTLTFDIPPQALSSALVKFSETTRLELLVDSGLTQGVQTPGVSGTRTSEEALRTMLAGTGLTYRFIEPRIVTLERDGSGSRVPAAAEAPLAAAERVTPNNSGHTDRNAQKPVKVPEILVKDVRERETAELDNLPPEYAGGQVASGGRVGILGNKNIMDTPFTQMNYTSKLIQDQQARFLTDVLRNDPSVQQNQSTSLGFMNFSIRGFNVDPNGILFNGLIGVAPTFNDVMMTEGIERVEVLRGPNALLTGVSPEGNIGGTVNLIPKRAGEEALTQLTAQYMSNSQVGGHVDFGRRFGRHKQFGIRINGVYRNGDTPIDHQSRESALTTVALDYRGDNVRLSADFGYQEQDTKAGRRQFTVANGVTAVPDPPDTRTNANQPWELNHSRALYGTVRGEVDVTKHITGFADFGINKDRRQSILSGRQIINAQGALATGAANPITAVEQQVLTFNAGVRGAFDTGFIHHQAVAAYTQYSRDMRTARGPVYNLPGSNIYDPVYAAAPSSSLLPGYGDVKDWIETRLSGVMVGDTLSILDERVQLTGGVRFQQIDVTTVDFVTGAPVSSYNKSAATPMIGLVIKPWQNVSLYGNYIEALQTGPTAPLTAANAGEVFAPFVSKGYEAGIKTDFGRIMTTLAAFQITRPSAFVDPATNVFSVAGEQRNRGVEFTVFGEVLEGLRLLGGTSYIDAELTKTQGGVNQGNRVNLPPFQFSLYGEWDVPFLTGFTMTSRVTHAASQFINFANTQRIREWTQWDLGARYRFERANGKPITIRANLENVLDTNAWYGGNFASGWITARDPRMFLLSATFDF